MYETYTLSGQLRVSDVTSLYFYPRNVLVLRDKQSIYEIQKMPLWYKSTVCLMQIYYKFPINAIYHPLEELGCGC